jgi:hypothetical protein
LLLAFSVVCYLEESVVIAYVVQPAAPPHVEVLYSFIPLQNTHHVLCIFFGIFCGLLYIKTGLHTAESMAAHNFLLAMLFANELYFLCAALPSKYKGAVILSEYVNLR